MVWYTCSLYVKLLTRVKTRHKEIESENIDYVLNC